MMKQVLQFLTKVRVLQALWCGAHGLTADQQHEPVADRTRGCIHIVLCTCPYVIRAPLSSSGHLASLQSQVRQDPPERRPKREIRACTCCRVAHARQWYISFIVELAKSLESSAASSVDFFVQVWRPTQLSHDTLQCRTLRTDLPNS
jgi:hypothetical protein